MQTPLKNDRGMSLWFYPVLSYVSLKSGLGLISPITLWKEKEEGEHIYKYFHLFFFCFC